MSESNLKQMLRDRGVQVLCPESVFVDSTIDPERIAPGVILHGGCRLSGTQTSIGPGSILGEEAPVTLNNCQVGSNAKLKGGFFSGSTLLDGVQVGSGAHFRPGTLLEENASCAHTVGLKQTVLMPFVTLGSLINFCDCLMAGGTSPSNHSEVGSSYIHFNFSAHQDKATPSLVGDVPRGVMLDQAPIFMGGQGGMVGPTRITYGSVIAAGTICRRDVLKEGKLLFGQTGHRIKKVNYDTRVYGDIDRICQNNFIYLGNLHALDAWYRHSRPIVTASDDIYAQACLKGAQIQIATMVTERIKRLTQLANKVSESLAICKSQNRDLEGGPFQHQRAFIKCWPEVAPTLNLVAEHTINRKSRDTFLETLTNSKTESYVKTIQNLAPDTRQAGSEWLQGIVDSIASRWGDIKNG